MLFYLFIIFPLNYLSDLIKFSIILPGDGKIVYRRSENRSFTVRTWRGLSWLVKDDAAISSPAAAAAPMLLLLRLFSSRRQFDAIAALTTECCSSKQLTTARSVDNHRLQQTNCGEYAITDYRNKHVCHFT